MHTQERSKTLVHSGGEQHRAQAEARGQLPRNSLDTVLQNLLVYGGGIQFNLPTTLMPPSELHVELHAPPN